MRAEGQNMTDINDPRQNLAYGRWCLHPPLRPTMTTRPTADIDAPTQDRSLLLERIRKQLLERVMPALDGTLAKVDDYLFDRSQSGHEDLGMIALRELRRLRGQITRRFEQAIVDGFRSLRESRDSAIAPDRQDLTLLSDQDLEEQLAVEQLADSVMRVQGSAPELAIKRLAHLAGREDLQLPDNPLSPAFLARALRTALDQAELDADVRIVVYKFFERELGAALGPAYDRSNQWMASAGVLPELRASAKLQPAAAPRAAPAPDAFADPAGAGHPAYPQQHPFPAHEMVQPNLGGGMDQAMFGNLLGLLQGWRGSQVRPQAPTSEQSAPGHVLGSSELMSILSLMQRDVPTQLQPSGGQASLVEQLRKEVAQNARRLGVVGDNDNLHLDGLDEDAVDLVALLFDVLLDGPQFDTNIRRKIGRMLVPYVKVAVKDRRMFLFKEHPARKLLNTVAEACEGNHGEAPQERELLGRVDHTIDRLVAEFNEDVAIFETLEQELRAYMAQHRRRFELAEKRASQVQHGRERLEHARSGVAAELMQHRAERDLPAVMDEFLTRHVAHHLTHVTLREGRDSPRYERALRAVDDMLVAFDYAELRTPPADLPALPRAEYEVILASSGCDGGAAQAAIDALQAALVRLSNGERAADNDTHMPEQVRLPDPEPEAPEPEPQLEIVGGTAQLDYDRAMLERMRALGVGHWLQLATSADRVEPAKVSWISPISGRLLLVNRRGIRVLVASAEELAAMAKLGKVSLRVGDTTFDNALHMVADRLKNAANEA